MNITNFLVAVALFAVPLISTADSARSPSTDMAGHGASSPQNAGGGGSACTTEDGIAGVGDWVFVSHRIWRKIYENQQETRFFSLADFGALSGVPGSVSCVLLRFDVEGQAGFASVSPPGRPGYIVQSNGSGAAASHYSPTLLALAPAEYPEIGGETGVRITAGSSANNWEVEVRVWLMGYVP